MIKFYGFNIIIRKMSQQKAQFTDFFVTNLTFFYVGIIDEGSPEDIGGKKLDLLQFIIPEIMSILLAFSYFPTYSEI